MRNLTQVGMLNQGGYKWDVYTITYVQQAGDTGSFSGPYNNQKRASLTYTSSGATMTLQSPTNRSYMNLNGYYIMDIGSASNTTKVSGTTIYLVTSPPTRPSTYQKVQKNSYFQGYSGTSPTGHPGYTINQGTGAFELTGSPKNIYPEAGALGYQIDYRGWLVEIRGNYNDNGYDITEYESQLTQSPNASVPYQAYTLVQARGDYIETVSAPKGTYPDNGISGGYWYVLQ